MKWEKKYNWINGNQRRRDDFNSNENFYRLADDYTLTRRRQVNALVRTIIGRWSIRAAKQPAVSSL